MISKALLKELDQILREEFSLNLNKPELSQFVKYPIL